MTKRFVVKLMDTFKISFEHIIVYKSQYSKDTAHNFRSHIFQWMDSIKLFPYSWKSIWWGLRVKVVDWFLLVYEVFDSEEVIEVYDVVDPRQHTEAKKYYKLSE